MTLRDDFGIVSRNAEMRLRYGHRVAHGKVATPPPPPPGVLAAAVNPFERVRPKAATVPAKYTTALCAMACRTPRCGETTATAAPPEIAIHAKCQAVPMTAIPTPIPTVRDILGIVSDVTGVSVVDMQSARRARVCTRPRQIVMWMARKHTPLSLPVIGDAIGHRDHTTVMHACRRIEELVAEGDQFIKLWIADAERSLFVKFPHMAEV